MIVQQLQEFLDGSDAAQGGRASGNQTTLGGMEERIGNIERMMGRLKDKAQIGKRNMVTPINPGPSKAVGAEELREETQRMDKCRQSEESKPARRRGFKPLNLSEVVDNGFSRFYVIKLTEE